MVTKKIQTVITKQTLAFDSFVVTVKATIKFVGSVEPSGVL
jgi:hypothetical protein